MCMGCALGLMRAGVLLRQKSCHGTHLLQRFLRPRLPLVQLIPFEPSLPQTRISAIPTIFGAPARIPC